MRKNPIFGRPLGGPKGSSRTISLGGVTSEAASNKWSTTTYDHAKFDMTVNGTKATENVTAIAVVASAAKVTTGNAYVEVRLQFSTTCRVGLIDDAASDGFANFIRTAQNGVTDDDAGQLAIVVGFTSGNTLGFAIDVENRRIWFRNLSSGNHYWNGDVDADPATGVGSFDAWDTQGNDVVMSLFAEGQNTSSIFTLNTGPTFLGTKPSGFSDWYAA